MSNTATSVRRVTADHIAGVELHIDYLRKHKEEGKEIPYSKDRSIAAAEKALVESSSADPRHVATLLGLEGEDGLNQVIFAMGEYKELLERRNGDRG